MFRQHKSRFNFSAHVFCREFRARRPSETKLASEQNETMFRHHKNPNGHAEEIYQFFFISVAPFWKELCAISILL